MFIATNTRGTPTHTHTHTHTLSHPDTHSISLHIALSINTCWHISGLPGPNFFFRIRVYVHRYNFIQNKKGRIIKEFIS